MISQHLQSLETFTLSLLLTYIALSVLQAFCVYYGDPSNTQFAVMIKSGGL